MSAPFESPQVLRELLDRVPAAVLVLDVDGTIAYANDEAVARLGPRHMRPVGKPFAVIVPLDERRALRKALLQAAQEPVDLTLHLDDEERSAVEIRPVASAPNLLVATIAPAGSREIRAVEPGNVGRRQVEALLQRFPEGVIGVNLDLEVTFANARARTLLGRDVVRPGRSLRSDGVEEPLRRVAASLVRAGASMPPTQVELAGRMVRVSGIAARGESPALVILDDVTEDARQDRAMREFVRNAAHQLRTPLTGIASAVGALQGGAKEAPATRDRFLAHVEHHVDRLTRIVRGLLTLARAQSGSPLRLDLVSLRPILEQVSRSVQPAEDVTLEIDCDAGVSAFCDADLTHEAVAALVENAVAHTISGSIRVVAAEDDGVVRLDVSDTGPGILPEHREHIFEPFYRVADAGSGFGLGLAIASQAVEAMSGSLEIRDADAGTCVTIRLPSARVRG